MTWPTDGVAELVNKLSLNPALPPGLALSQTHGSPPAALSAPNGAADLLGAPGSPSTADKSVEHNLGWGGQAIPDTMHFKAPWFGKNRARGGGVGRGRGAGRGSGRGGAAGAGRRGGVGRRPGSWSLDGSDDGEGGPILSVDAVAAMVGAAPPGEPLGSDVRQALFGLDSRSCAALLKDLAKGGMLHRAVELFNWLRELDATHPLATSLLDAYTYTAAISLCIAQHDAERALQLASEMGTRGVTRNVHTYTALMNVLIKCGRHGVALDTYRVMRAEGCAPNVVTFNTLIDVHGKMGNWEEAVGVLAAMEREGVQPVLRTFNTLIITCNSCSQPREAVAVYRRMLGEGFSPNATTYNALISAYGKEGQLHKVMEVFQEMTCRGCERSVITYSSLISACEKAGQWELALEFFREMCRERCAPNTVTYNSLITALAQGGQWEKAGEVFERMGSSGCRPDVVTYTALISALEKGGQWQRALEAFERMRAAGCKADGIVFNAIIDALWGTGVVWAQRKALALFRGAVSEGHFVQAPLTPGLPRAEVNLHAMTAGVAMLSLHSWLLNLRVVTRQHGPQALPGRLAIVTDRGRGAREAGNLVVKEAVAAAMAHWGAPFRPVADSGCSGLLEGSGPLVAEWLVSGAFEERLFSFFPCTDTMPAGPLCGAPSLLDPAVAASVDDLDGSKESSVEARCCEAFAAVRHFERTHCLALQNMGCAYLQRRAALVARCLELAERLHVSEEVAHDAVLLMDRVMSTALGLQPQLLDLLATACLVISVRQQYLADDSGSPAQRPHPAMPTEAELEAASGQPPSAVEQMERSVRAVLGGDTAAISSLRCLKLYLERLGAVHLPAPAAAALAGSALLRARESLSEMAFLNCRPSVIGAALLYAERRARGLIPFWPTMLAKLTGYQDMSTPELAVAIKAAQRLTARSDRPPSATGLSRPPSSSSLSSLGTGSISSGGNSSGASLASATNAGGSGPLAAALLAACKPQPAPVPAPAIHAALSAPLSVAAPAELLPPAASPPAASAPAAAAAPIPRNLSPASLEQQLLVLQQQAAAAAAAGSAPAPMLLHAMGSGAAYPTHAMAAEHLLPMAPMVAGLHPLQPLGGAGHPHAITTALQAHMPPAGALLVGSAAAPVARGMSNGTHLNHGGGLPPHIAPLFAAAHPGLLHH